MVNLAAGCTSSKTAVAWLVSLLAQPLAFSSCCYLLHLFLRFLSLFLLPVLRLPSHFLFSLWYILNQTRFSSIWTNTYIKILEPQDWKNSAPSTSLLEISMMTTSFALYPLKSYPKWQNIVSGYDLELLRGHPRLRLLRGLTPTTNGAHLFASHRGHERSP